MNYFAKNWLAFSMLVAGLAVTTLGLTNRKRAIESADWPSVPGLVTKSTIVTKTKRRRSQRQGPRQVHLPEIEYSYTVGNTQLQHKQIYFSDDSAARIVKKYPKGQAVTVTYNPKDVNDSFLEPPSLQTNAVVCGLGTFFAFIGIAMLVVPKLLHKPPVQPPTPIEIETNQSAEDKHHPVTIGEISQLLGRDVRELITNGWTDTQIENLIDQKLAEFQLIT